MSFMDRWNRLTDYVEERGIVQAWKDGAKMGVNLVRKASDRVVGEAAEAYQVVKEKFKDEPQTDPDAYDPDTREFLDELNEQIKAEIAAERAEQDSRRVNSGTNPEPLPPLDGLDGPAETVETREAEIAQQRAAMDQKLDAMAAQLQSDDPVPSSTPILGEAMSDMDAAIAAREAALAGMGGAEGFGNGSMLKNAGLIDDAAPAATTPPVPVQVIKSDFGAGL